MKLGIPAILIAALIVASPAFAQNMNYTGTTSKPGASFQKDDTTNLTKRSKKQTVSHKKKHHAKQISSKAQTTGSGAGANKDETMPKSR